MSLATRIKALWQGPTIERIRRVLLPLSFVVATLYMGAIVHKHYPLQKWLFLRYAGYWLAGGVWTLACLGAGHRALRALGAPREGLREQVILSFGLGVLLFFLGAFVAGLLGLLRWPLFFALPLLLLAIGGKALFQLGRRCLRVARFVVQRRHASSLGERLLGAAVGVLAVVAITLVYASVIPPENASFDARWYHLGIAEHYVAHGGIRPFAEGWYMGAFPHLASVLYAWAFLVPTGRLFDQVALSAHLEFILFLWTLAGVSVLTRRLVPRARPRFAFAVMLLFPGLYLYDSSLALGADHVAAFWAPLVFLTFLRAYRDFTPRSFALAAAALSGPLLTKYTAASLVVFPVLGLGFGLMVRLVRSARARSFDRSLWLGPVTGLLTGLVITAPHWLKNWLWYGNPIYPMASEHFRTRPWSASIAELYKLRGASGWAPKGPASSKIAETLAAVVTFSFKPHDWPKFHGSVPVFGSLFTLSMVALPFARGTRRLWALAIAAHVAVFFWYWTQHEDRYLQAVVPWMAAVTAAVVTLAWRTSVASRVAVGSLLVLQLVWGADVYFFPAHAMLGRAPINLMIDLMASGYKRQYDERLEVFAEGASIGKGLPPGAKVLVHEANNPRLGIGAEVVTDVVGFQGGLDYGRLDGPQQVFAKLHGMGVTHVAWKDRTSRGTDSYAGDLVFHDFIARNTIRSKPHGGWSVAEIVDARADPGLSDDVLFLGCQTTYAWGLYARHDMVVPEVGSHAKSEYPRPRSPIATEAEAGPLVARARYVVFDAKCAGQLPAGVQASFTNLAQRGGAQFWGRTPEKHSR